MQLEDRFLVYQVAVEAILTKILASMPEEQVDDWLTNDANLLTYQLGPDPKDEKGEFYQLVFGRIKDGAESRRSRQR